VRANGELLAGLVAHLILVGTPGAAATLYAVRRGVKDVPLLLGIGLAGSGATALVAFFAYYADSFVGQTWDFFLFFGSLLLIVQCWRAGLDRETLRQLRTPLLLWIAGSCFVVFFGFLHGGTDNAVTMSSYRFSTQLPSDNDMPRYFAEQFAAHGHSHPLPVYPGGWLTSDRPPLQIGYVLAERAFLNSPHGLHYEILAVIVQAFWIVAMWAVLVAARLRPRTRAMAIVAAMVSDVALVHGFFVWPKLIAAAFVLAAFAILISPAWDRNRRDPRVAALVGALLALAMLSHGSSIFGVIPLVFLAFWRGLPNWRWVGAAILGGLALMGPWVAYQHYADPPGNRLLKWQLGGDINIDSKGTLEAIEDGYSEVGLDGAIDLKEENFSEMIGWSRGKREYEAAIDGLEEGKPGIAAAKVRGLRFFTLLPFLGILLVGPLAMIFARLRRIDRNEEEWRFALACFAFLVIACVCWGLLLFGTPEARTTIHVGSLAIPLLGLVGCVVGLRSCFPRFAAWIVGLNVLMVLVLYTPSLEPDPGTSYSPIAAVLACASLAAFAFLAFRGTNIVSPDASVVDEGHSPAQPALQAR
jgi:hypothetical protein